MSSKQNAKLHAAFLTWQLLKIRKKLYIKPSPHHQEREMLTASSTFILIATMLVTSCSQDAKIKRQRGQIGSSERSLNLELIFLCLLQPNHLLARIAIRIFP
jgi:hypothetical protein